MDTIICGQTIHLLKINTQGSELAVLRDAEALFHEKRVNMVELEFWPNRGACGAGER